MTDAKTTHTRLAKRADAINKLRRPLVAEMDQLNQRRKEIARELWKLSDRADRLYKDFLKIADEPFIAGYTYGEVQDIWHKVRTESRTEQ